MVIGRSTLLPLQKFVKRIRYIYRVSLDQGLGEFWYGILNRTPKCVYL